MLVTVHIVGVLIASGVVIHSYSLGCPGLQREKLM